MKNLKIGTKLLTLVIFMMATLVVISLLSLSFMSRINAGSTVITENWMPSVISAQSINTLTSDFRIKEYKHILSQTPEEMSEAANEMQQANQEIEQQIAAYKQVISDDVDKKLIESIETDWQKYLTIHEQVAALSQQNKSDEAMVIMRGESQTLFDTVSGNCLTLVEFNQSGGDKASQQGDALYASATTITLASLIVIVLVSLIIAIYIMRSITRPVKEIDHVARTIAEGKLDESIHYQSKDELGMLAQNFNKTVTRLRDYVNYIDEISSVLDEIARGNLMFQLTYDYAGEFAKVKTALENISESLNDTIGQINQSSDQVSSGSDQVSSGAQALSQGATEQASSVQELAATINEISDQVRDNAENAIQASRMMDSLGGEIQKSDDQMQALISAMAEISDKSGEIGKIIKTIEDIAFQTNILALNAAVEAARAGAAGKGFAVVADEVRNLASKSAEAASNTTALIEGSLKAVDGGTKIADETAQSLLKVVEEAKNVIGTVTKISNASNEQASSIAQVTQGVDQISAVVQTNSATAEESAAASEELSSQAQMLKNLVGRFKLKSSPDGLSLPDARAKIEAGPAEWSGSKY